MIDLEIEDKRIRAEIKHLRFCRLQQEARQSTIVKALRKNQEVIMRIERKISLLASLMPKLREVNELEKNKH
jgi:hypothetical protein